MELIAKLNLDPNNNWIFIVSVLLLAYTSIIKYNYYDHFSLIIKSVYSEKHANNFLREASNFFQKFNLMPVFIVSVALILVKESLSISYFFKVVFCLILYFIFKYFILIFIGYVLEKSYLFEEVIFQSFLYEKVSGLIIFPSFLFFFYGPFQFNISTNHIVGGLIFLLTYKWLRILYLSFFNSGIIKTHIIIYLCTFELLPIVIITKYLS